MSAPALVTGIFPDMAEAAYRAATGMNQSALKEFRKSAAHFKHASQEPPSPPSPAMEVGLVVETLVFQPDRLEEKFVLAPKNHNGRTNEGKAWKAEQVKSGKIVVEADTMKACEAMAGRVGDLPHIANLLTKGSAQVAVFAPLHVFDVKQESALDGPPGLRAIQCKGLIDWVPWKLNCLVDYKTTSDASKEGFARSVANYGYDVQAAWYLDLYAKATADASRSLFVFVVQENVAPFETAAYVLDPEDVDRGREKYRKWLELFVKCQRSGQWPGYQTSEFETLKMPAWARKEAV